jgi:hypothetical protein
VRLAALNEIDRNAHRRILLVAQRLRRRLVHRDDFGRVVHAQARSRRRAPGRELGLERVAHADQHHVNLGHARLELERSRDRHMGAVVAAHAIDRDGDQCGYSSSRVLMTFLPR